MIRLAAPALVAGLVIAPAGAHAQFRTPEDAVRALYALYEAKDATGFPSDAKGVRRFLTADLAQQYRRAKHMGADFFIQGQDFEIAEIKVGEAAVQGEKASVQAAFKNFGKPMKLTYSLTKNADGWRISDAKHGKTTLRASIRQSQ